MYLSNGHLDALDREKKREEEEERARARVMMEADIEEIAFPMKVKKIVRKKSMERWLTVHGNELFYAKNLSELEDTFRLDKVKKLLSKAKFAMSKKLSDPKSSICWIPSHRIIAIETWSEGSLAITTRNGSKKTSKTFWFKPLHVSAEALQNELSRIRTRATAAIKIAS